MNIVVLDGYAANPGDLSWNPLKEIGKLTVYERTAQSQVEERAKNADIILTNKVLFDEGIFDRLPRLKYLGIQATGFNTVDLDAARAHNVVVTNVPAYSTDSVVQMTFAHLLNITNRVGHYASEVRGGRWSSNPDFCYWNTPLVELSGKIFGIVGLGHIGMKVAQMARAFGMDVFAATSKNSAELPDGIQKTTLSGLYGVSDILSLHCPLCDDTRQMINSETIAQMKRGAILINTSRGQLVNEADVAEALKNGQLGAYGADVMCEEPPAADSPLFFAPNAFITPHIAWASVEARSRLLHVVFDNVRAFIAGKPKNVVS